MLVAPAVAMVAAWLLLGDRPNAAELAGGVLLLAGALVALRPPRTGPAEPTRRTRVAAVRGARPAPCDPGHELTNLSPTSEA